MASDLERGFSAAGSTDEIARIVTRAKELDPSEDMAAALQRACPSL
jgi:hypothetical protein